MGPLLSGLLRGLGEQQSEAISGVDNVHPATANRQVQRQQQKSDSIGVILKDKGTRQFIIRAPSLSVNAGGTLPYHRQFLDYSLAATPHGRPRMQNAFHSFHSFHSFHAGRVW
jgi:hypothetical protein